MRAIRFAKAAHAGQFRKGTSIPYIDHLLRVMNTLTAMGYPEDVGIAGLLHDCIEDVGVHPEVIKERFGENVMELVLSATEPAKIPGNPDGVQQDWQSRKEHTFQVLEAMEDEHKLVIALADKLDNIQCIAGDLEELGDALWDRFNAPREKQAWYYKGLARIFQRKTERLSPAYQSLSAEFSSMVKEVF
jgi:(p)ppGpp synthase/HD superfamily hydrolase